MTSAPQYPVPVSPLDIAAMGAAAERWATRAKPPGSLGQLETVGIHLAGVTGRCPPGLIQRPAVTVFAGDHGVVAAGASAWPSEVTGLMVSTMAEGQAAISAIAGVVGATLEVVDIGVAHPVRGPGVIDANVARGTADLSVAPAMTLEQADAAFSVGRERAAAAVLDGADLLVAGDMGIGNTTASTCLIAWTTGSDPAALTGPGAGLAADQLPHKMALISAALDRSRGLDPLAMVASIGGLEIVAMAGYYTEAAARGVPFVVDGVIACAALCAADQLSPGVAERAIAGHRSSEPAASAALAHYGLEPLIDLDLRLGEGTGAALAVPLVQAAAACLSNMADLPA